MLNDNNKETDYPAQMQNKDCYNIDYNYYDEDDSAWQNEIEEDVFESQKMTDEEYFDYLEQEKRKQKIKDIINKIMINMK